VLGAYLIGLALVAFWPTPVDKPVSGALTAGLRYLHKLGAPGWLDYHVIEATANVAMFIPFGFLLTKALPAKSWCYVTGMSLLTSTVIEVWQLLFISDRFSSILDIVTNTLGAVIGQATRHLVDRRKSAETTAALT
jgi:glycopeptide antibiotics resistance protein